MVIFTYDFGLSVVAGVDAAALEGATVGTSRESGACRRTIGEAEAESSACIVAFSAGNFV